MVNEVFAEQLNGKEVQISHQGAALMVRIAETGQLIPNAYDVMVYSYDGLMAHVQLSHWYEPEQRYHTEIATCQAQFA